MESGKWREVSIDAITIGPRFRKDLGDIAALAASIEDIGLLHPIIVTTDWTRPHHCGHMWELAVPHLPSRMIDFKGLAREQFYISS